MLGPLFALAAAAALVQSPQATPPQQAQGEALRVFLDCQWECDETFLRTEITFVNYVRDRYDAQLVVLVTTQQTGGRGTDFTLTFIGQREFQGRSDTLHYISEQGNTSDETRRGFARVLRLGLVRYSMSTPLAAHLDVRYTPPSTAAAREQRDRWDRWVFRTRLNSNFNGEKSNAYNSYSGSFTAARVTERWKANFSVNGNENRNRYEVPTYDSLGNVAGDTTYRTKRQRWGVEGQLVRSLGEHWSAGLGAEVSGSTYGNMRTSLVFAPAVEWDLFPYSQSTRRQLTVRYAVGVQSSNYRDTTVYGKISETFGRHSIDVGLGLRQPWGNVNLSLEGVQYWNDARNPNLDLFVSTDVRVVRGLSVNFYGGYSFVKSQRFLPAISATPEDVLLQLRQLRTNYSYWGGIGLSFTFGSVYNNVVNPRFGSGGGSIIIMN